LQPGGGQAKSARTAISEQEADELSRGAMNGNLHDTTFRTTSWMDCANEPSQAPIYPQSLWRLYVAAKSSTGQGTKVCVPKITTNNTTK